MNLAQAFQRVCGEYEGVALRVGSWLMARQDGGEVNVTELNEEHDSDSVELRVKVQAHESTLHKVRSVLSVIFDAYRTSGAQAFSLVVDHTTMPTIRAAMSSSDRLWRVAPPHSDLENVLVLLVTTCLGTRVTLDQD